MILLRIYPEKDALLEEGKEGYDWRRRRSERGCLDLHLAGGQWAVVDTLDAGFRGAFIGYTTAPRSSVFVWTRAVGVVGLSLAMRRQCQFVRCDGSGVTRARVLGRLTEVRFVREWQWLDAQALQMGFLAVSLASEEVEKRVLVTECARSYMGQMGLVILPCQPCYVRGRGRRNGQIVV